ncbi:MAG TPA: sensor histidine kinase [Ktedonobacteraceae bacterium]|nr:sensor histidine kinase [Ktedonobacteraceae bacterium]
MPSILPIDPVSYPLGVICVLLMTLQFCLHWICLSGKLQQRWYWFYFLLQGVCVLIISFIWPDTILALGLYLVLVIEALSMLKQVQQTVGVGATCLLLFILTIAWQLTQVAIWMTFESVLLLILFIIGWIILLIQQAHTRSQLEAAHLQLAAYAMRIEELTLVNERQRLARELHDTLAQDLVGLTLQLERVDLHLEKKRVERARELVQQAMSRSRATLAEARSAIDDLRATTLNPNDLLLAVQREINRFRATTSISCVADINALSTVPESLCEHVLRAITEGLTNVARHSQAHQVWICARLDAAMLTIEVRDDGIGFDNKEIVTHKGHYGLLGLRERARLSGGNLDIESAVGKGTLLRLRLPINRRGGLD